MVCLCCVLVLLIVMFGLGGLVGSDYLSIIKKKDKFFIGIFILRDFYFFI